MLTSLTCVLGYLAAIPEGGGVLGKKAMATLTHMSTGGLLYVNSVFTIHVGGTRCVTSNADEIDLIDLIPPLIALIDLIDLTPPWIGLIALIDLTPPLIDLIFQVRKRRAACHQPLRHHSIVSV